MRKFPGPVKGNHNYLNADIPRRPINPKTQSITEKKINEGEARSISYSNKLSTNANLRNSSNTGLGKPESRSGNNRVLSTPPKPQELSQSSGKKGNEDKARSIIYSNKLSSNANSRNSSNAGVSKPESRSGISKVVSTPSKPQEPKQSSGSSKTIQAPQQKPNQNEEKLKITNQNIKINSRVTRDVALKDTNLNVHYTDKRHYDVSYTFGNKTQDQDERQSRNLNRVPKSENQNFDHVKNPQNSQYDAIYSIYKSPSPVQDNWGRNKDLHYREDKYQNSQANPVPAWSLQNFQASKENKTESIVQKSIGSNISEIGNERSRRNRFEDDRKNIVHPYNAAYDIKRTDNSYAYGIVCTPKPKSLANCNSGLPNIGNTCYMNSVLQILVSTEGFEGIVAWINQPFFTYLSNIFKLMKSKSGNLASAISQFKNELSSEFSMFQGCTQNDSKELFQIIISKVADEKPNFDLFLIKRVKRFICRGHDAGSPEESSSFFVVPTNRIRSIQSYIDGLKNPERFQGANALYCDKCDCLRDMTIETTSIETRANLVFYLTPAPTSFIPEDNITIENNNYRLYGVICHIGTNLSGHYFAYTYCEAENSWVEYNDSMVSFADKPNFRCAYMLFYKNKN